MRIGRLIGAQLAALALTVLYLPWASAASTPEVSLPQVFLQGIAYDLDVTAPPHSMTLLANPPVLRVDEEVYTATALADTWRFHDVMVTASANVGVELELDGQRIQQADVPTIPAWVSVLPPLVAIGMALLLRSVLPALMLGLWLGAWALEGLSGTGIFTGLFASFEVYVANAVADFDHATIMLFTFMIAGMVGIISRNGGMRGIVEWIITGANSAKRGQLAVWSLGLLIFFDDYSNTLVVGNTSRSITDR